MNPDLEKSVPIAKIAVPQPSDIVRRERLFKLLDGGRSRPVIWLSAPAGSGKTTLIASYLEFRKLPCLWYQVDEGDADISTFLYYMGLAVRQAYPKKKETLPLLTPEYLLDIPTFTKRYFEKLYSIVGRPFAIVLDNYQDAPVHSPFHGVMQTAISMIPKGVTVVAVSRSEPPPLFAGSNLKDAISFIGWNEVRFTFDESKELLGTRRRIGVDGETLSRLYAKTDGWVAGLLLILEDMKSGGVDPQKFDGLASDEIFNYFAGELFGKADRETRDFLIKSALLPRVTVHIAEQITGKGSSEQILSRLNRNHFFTEIYPGAVPVYQYHPLFRKFLISQAEQSLAPGEIAGLRHKAALVLEESGRIEDAAGLFMEASDWNGLSKMILKTAQTMIAQGRNRTLEGWFNGIPDNMTWINPWLLFWKGVCITPFNPPEGQDCLEKAFELFVAQKDRAGIFLSWSAVADIFLYVRGSARFDPWVSRLDEILKKDGSFPSPDIEARVSLSMLNALSFGQPYHPDLAMWADRVFGILEQRKDVDVNARLTSGVYLGVYSLWKGDLGRAAIVLDLLHKIATAGVVSEIVRITIKTYEALYALFADSPDSCIEKVEEGISIAEKSGIHVWDNHLLLHGLCAAIGKGDETLFRQFQQRLNTEGGPKVDIYYHRFLLAWDAQLRGDMNLALDNMKMASNANIDVGFEIFAPFLHIKSAEIYYQSGDETEAKKHLTTAYEKSCGANSALFEYMCLLLDSHMKFNEGNDDKGLALLSDALKIGREHYFENLCWWKTPFMTQLCLKALDHGIEVGYVQELIKKRNLTPPIPLFSKEGERGGFEAWPWPVKVYTLGRFELLIGDKPAAFSRKAPKKPLEMLKTIIAFGGRASDEELSDALWPDAEGDAAHESFAVTLKRLRHLIGYSDAIKHSEGCVSLNPRYFWVDAFAFEEILGGLSLFTDKAQRSRRIGTVPESMEKALDMYKGAFLPMDNEQHYVLSFRERLRQKSLYALEALGSCYEEKGEIKKAVRCYRKGLEVDDLAEGFYQRLMACYEKMGRLAEAINVYKRCRNTLSVKLGILPSRETERIYKTIRGEYAVYKE